MKNSYYASINTMTESINLTKTSLEMALSEVATDSYVPVYIKQHRARLKTLIDLRDRILNGDFNIRSRDDNYDL